MRSGFSWMRDTVHVAQDYVQRRVDLAKIAYTIWKGNMEMPAGEGKVLQAVYNSEGRENSVQPLEKTWFKQRKLVVLKDFSYEEGCEVLRMPRPDIMFSRQLKFSMGHRNMLVCGPKDHLKYHKPHEKFLNKRVVTNDYELMSKLILHHLRTNREKNLPDETSLKGLTLKIVLTKAFGFDPEKDIDQIQELTDELYHGLNFTDPRPMQLLKNQAHAEAKIKEVLSRHYAHDLPYAEKMSSTIMLLMAGMHTTANTIQFMLIYFEKNIQILRELIKRIRENGNTEDFIKNDPWYERCFLETLRLHPIFPIIARTADKNTKIADLEVAKGDLIALDIHTMQRSKALFGEKPGGFHPERWENDRSRKRRLMTFGKGPMQCIGQHLARLEVKSFVLHSLITLPRKYYSAEGNYVYLKEIYNGNTAALRLISLKKEENPEIENEEW